jgi:hypothetical protein
VNLRRLCFAFCSAPLSMDYLYMLKKVSTKPDQAH